MSHVGDTLSFFLTFLSFYLSRFSFYINIKTSETLYICKSIEDNDQQVNAMIASYEWMFLFWNRQHQWAHSCTSGQRDKFLNSGSCWWAGAGTMARHWLQPSWQTRWSSLGRLKKGWGRQTGERIAEFIRFTSLCKIFIY